MLTKDKILAGIRCKKRLWLQENTPGAPLSRSANFIIQQEQAIELEAHKKFPNGKCATMKNRDAALNRTLELMAGDAECLFRPSISAGGAYVRCDILRKRNGVWDIIKVKSSVWKGKDKVKNEHIDDLAVQWHVAESAGVPLGDAFLMLVNSADCVFPNLSNLMWEEEVTDQVRVRAAEIPDLLREFEETLDKQATPQVSIGKHCTKPRECQFLTRYKAQMGEAGTSIFTIPAQITTVKKLIDHGARLAVDAPHAAKSAGVKLADNALRYAALLESGQPKIDKEGLCARLNELEFPLYFLDFETTNPAIPRFDGMRPYQHFPFQFSCHIMRKEDGDAKHFEYLHKDKDDPRPPLLSHLADCVGRTGSIVVWHAVAEKGFLKELANYATEEQKELLDRMADRLWDLELVFTGKKDEFPPLYRHPDFLGRTSLKAVLPALTGKSYDGLEIKDGADAMAAWDLTIHGKEDYTKALLEYCHLDTEAMVLIYRHLLDELAR